MKRWVAALFLGLGCVAAADLPAVRTTHQGRSFGGDALPTFQRGHLFYLSGKGTVAVWGPDGQRLFETSLTDPDGNTASASSVAIDSDGIVAVSIGFSTPTGYAGGIAYLDQTGRQWESISTRRYMPTHLCFDDQSRLWTFGWQRDLAHNDREDEEPYMLVRRFSKDRKEDGGFLERSLFPGKLDPFGSQRGLWRVQAATDRIGGLAYPNVSEHPSEWVELDLEGNLIGRWLIDPDIRGGYAYTASGRLFVRDGQGRGLFQLDRDLGRWTLVEAPEQGAIDRGLLLGASGDELVFAQDSGARLVHIDSNAFAH